MQGLILIVVLLLGLAVGSFLNVVIYRTLSNESIVKGRSKCPKCKQKIAWYDNIPLLSYVFLGGKCRKCKKKISIQYPVIEGMTGILFLWWYGVGSAFFRLTQQPLTYIQPLFWLVVGILMLIILVTDLMTYLIPDYAVGLLGTAALVYRIYLTSRGIMNPVDLWRAVVVGLALAGFFMLLIGITKGKGMGWGDVKLTLALGLLLGWPRAVVGVFLAFVGGSIVGLGLIGTKKKKFGQVIPFGPFLIVGAGMGLLWGEWLWQQYLLLL